MFYQHLITRYICILFLKMFVISSLQSAFSTHSTLLQPKSGIRTRPGPSCTVPGLNQSPLCVEWNRLSLGNDFSRVDKSQHGDLQLGEQPFGYTEPCLH